MITGPLFLSFLARVGFLVTEEGWHGWRGDESDNYDDGG